MTTETEPETVTATPTENVRNLITIAGELARLISETETGHPFAAYGIKFATGRSIALVGDLKAALTWLERPEQPIITEE
jgi:hypothetical protein